MRRSPPLSSAPALSQFTIETLRLQQIDEVSASIVLLNQERDALLAKSKEKIARATLLLNSLEGSVAKREEAYSDYLLDTFNKNDRLLDTAATLESIVKRYDGFAEELEKASIAIESIQTKEEERLEAIDGKIALFQEKHNDLSKEVSGSAHDVMPMPLATLRLNCAMCDLRLSWLSDAALFGSQNLHLAVMFKCCCEFVGESCARRVFSPSNPKCPLCRETLIVDGSVNKVDFGVS